MIRSESNIFIYFDEEDKGELEATAKMCEVLADEISSITCCDASETLRKASYFIEEILKGKPVY